MGRVMELIDIIDEDGNFTGEVRYRDDVHREGLWHCAVHVWMYNSKGQILIQKRSAIKDSFPNEWDISCGGHIAAGHSSLNTVLKEVHEELGIDIGVLALVYLGQFTKKSVTNNGTFKDNEHDFVYIAECEDEFLDEFVLQEEEVSEVKWISLDELVELSKDINTVFPHHEESITLVVKHFERLKGLEDG
jgi:isopentenyl-diphosphate delta-isomerase type 1